MKCFYHDLVLQSFHDTNFGDVARGAGLDDAGLLGEGIDALAGLASLTALGHELADAVEAEALALFHLVVDEFKETFVDLLAHLSLDTLKSTICDKINFIKICQHQCFEF